MKSQTQRPIMIPKMHESPEQLSARVWNQLQVSSNNLQGLSVQKPSSETREILYEASVNTPSMPLKGHKIHSMQTLSTNSWDGRTSKKQKFSVIIHSRCMMMGISHLTVEIHHYASSWEPKYMKKVERVRNSESCLTCTKWQCNYRIK